MMTELSQVETARQILTFLYSILTGVALCLCYDLLRCRRALLPAGTILVFLQDVLYFSFSAVVVFCLLAVRCNGVLRLYVLLGILVGFVLGRLTISPFIYKALVAFFSFFTGLICKLLGPVFRCLLKIKRCLFALAAKLFCQIKNIFKRKKKPLENDISVDV